MRAAAGRAGALALLSAFLLAGCYPDLDWKELRSVEGRFKVLMPARSEAASGMGVDGARQMRWAAQTPDALFGIGFADYPDGASTHLAALRESLVRNANGRLAEDRELDARSMKGRAITISGKAADGSARELHAWLIAHDNRLYQLAVVSKPGALTGPELDTFFLSFEATD